MTTPLPPPTVGSDVLYSPSAALTSPGTTPPPQPRVAPVAHFASLPNDGIGNDALLKKAIKEADGAEGGANKVDAAGIPTSGRLLAINSSYIAYAVKKGLVRVIDRRSAAKALLRGHDENTRIVDAAFFGDGSHREGVGGLWDPLAALHRAQKGRGSGGEKEERLPPAAASDVLATLSGASERDDAASILIWRLHSSGSSLEADKLLEVRYGNAGRIMWHPFNPNRFLLLRRNLGRGDGENGGGGRTVATFVETTRLVTRTHETEPHSVCDCTEKEVGGGVPGMTPLQVFDDEEADVSLAGANDLAWSHRDAKHVLTGHDDGRVRLWDLTSPAATAGEESTFVPCIAKVDVASGVSSDASGRRVTRVVFLSQYESATLESAATPPFVTGTDMNHTIALWSPFPSVGSAVGTPARLRVFGLRDAPTPSFPLASMLGVELIPAPYRPPLASEHQAIVPSSFLLLAERGSGAVHALHLDTQWKDGSEDAVSVRGFDYVTTLNAVHPVYSYCVAPASAEGDGSHGGTGSLQEERDVELCCLQSKAVQILTLGAEMCGPPEDGAGVMAGVERTELAPGVTLLDLPADVSDDEGEGMEEEEEFEEEYDMDDEGTGAEYSTNDSGDDEDEDDEGEAVPTATEGEPNAFSNWLGAIASPLPAPTAAAPSAAAPPGLDFPSILPPPPGMSPAEPVAPPPPPAGMAFLSPLQILGGSDGAETKPEPVPPPAASAKPGKKPSKKKDAAKKAPAHQSAGPTKILQRAEPREEAAAPPPPAAASAAVKAHDSEFLLAAVREVVSAEVGRAVRAAVVDSFQDANKKPADKATEQAVQRGVANGIAAGLSPSLERSLAAALAENGALGARLERHAKESAARAAGEAVAAMQPLLVASLNQTMREATIPAYEAATRQMFQQTSASLEQGMKQMAMNQQANGAASMAPTLQALSAQMMKMTEAMHALSAEVVQLRGAVAAAGAGPPAAPAPPQGGPAQPMGVRPAVAALCQSRRYEEAFTKAVSASNGDVVLFACKHADIAAVFNGEVAVSQPILICVMQQLGAVLITAADPEDVTTILKWLQEIAVTIDPSNPNIQRHIGSVVQQLLANINSKMSNCDPAYRRPLQMLMQVIRGLL